MKRIMHSLSINMFNKKKKEAYLVSAVLNSFDKKLF